MNTTLLAELHQVGDIRQAGCILRIEDGRYVMENGRNIFDRHTLDIEHTSPARLEAHWLQFASAHREV